MGTTTKIEWADATWNPVRGCTPISTGCKHCYAKTLAERFRGVPGHPFEQGFDVRLVPEKLEEPLKWRRPRRVFVNSMSDLFHSEVPPAYVDDVFDVMRSAPQHTFMVLTKRPRVMVVRDWPSNVWAGVSVENADCLWRVEALKRVPAKRFLSLEPLLGPLEALELEGVDWVIVGGESGPEARPLHPGWVRQIRDQCLRAEVPFFFKQWGAWAPDCLCTELVQTEGGALSLRLRPKICRTTPRPSGKPGVMFRCGKKAAAELDGRGWMQFPEGM